jgi:hypothetical protein
MTSFYLNKNSPPIYYGTGGIETLAILRTNYLTAIYALEYLGNDSDNKQKHRTPFLTTKFASFSVSTYQFFRAA